MVEQTGTHMFHSGGPWCCAHCPHTLGNHFLLMWARLSRELAHVSSIRPIDKPAYVGPAPFLAGVGRRYRCARDACAVRGKNCQPRDSFAAAPGRAHGCGIRALSKRPRARHELDTRHALYFPAEHARWAAQIALCFGAPGHLAAQPVSATAIARLAGRALARQLWTCLLYTSPSPRDRG